MEGEADSRMSGQLPQKRLIAVMKGPLEDAGKISHRLMVMDREKKDRLRHSPPLFWPGMLS
jgi:hypothetical protein